MISSGRHTEADKGGNGERESAASETNHNSQSSTLNSQLNDGKSAASETNHNSQSSTLNYQFILKRYWGYDDFRGIQREIIESISSGHDTLGLMPTGGGKSITFQVPALAMEGVCIVVTPLIALMKDQVQHLRRRHIHAAAIYSGMQRDDIITTLENAIFGAIKILYVSPERLGSELFRAKLRHMHVSFITVDEAHCISQWGYDFRPSYLQIADIRKDLPGVPVLALTATATPQVVEDIKEKLSREYGKHSREYGGTGVRGNEKKAETKGNLVPPYPRPPVPPYPHPPVPPKFNVYRMSFKRTNLAYVVRTAADKVDETIHILRNVSGSAIVYARSRRRTRELAEQLSAAGLSATFFHAGLDNAEKDRRQRDWQEDRVRVMVATNAFGMGIDKPDVRVVIHVDCPSSVEAYFQEAGRAGRDGHKAYAVLLYNGSDHSKLEKRISDTFPEKDYVRQVYEHLAYFYQVAVGSGYNAIFEFPIDKFCHTFHHFPIQVDAALKILTRAGYIEYTEEQENQARVMFSLERDELYRLDNNTPDEERIIVTLLRNYTGLFVDFQYIDESFLAQQAGIKLTQVYHLLKSLADKHVLRFIPQKRTPYIRYTQRREESRLLMFPPAVYEELKQRYAERISAMTAYAETPNQCRSRQLLRYFGEQDSHDCGQCDVCLSHPQTDSAEEAIMQLLADGRPHPITDLKQLSASYNETDAALAHLLAEERVKVEDGLLTR